MVYFLDDCSSGGLLAYAESQSNIGSPSVVDDKPDESRKKRVVVLGTGWAGTSFLKYLDATAYDVQVVSPRNYFAFTPLLPSVTCGTVEARSIVEPVRNIIKKVSDTFKSCRNSFMCLCISCMERLITYKCILVYVAGIRWHYVQKFQTVSQKLMFTSYFYVMAEKWRDQILRGRMCQD